MAFKNQQTIKVSFTDEQLNEIEKSYNPLGHQKNLPDFKANYPIDDPIEFLELYIRSNFVFSNKPTAFFPVSEKEKFETDNYKGILLVFDEQLPEGRFHISFD